MQWHLTLAFCCLLNAYDLKSFAVLLVAFLHLFFAQNTGTKVRLACVCSLNHVTYDDPHTRHEYC